MSYFDDASLVMIPSGYKTSKVYSVKPTDGSGDLTFSRSNDTATRVNSSGLIEKVRTNLLRQSNSFTNVLWVNGDSSIAASGSEWAWTANTNSTFHYTYQSHSYTSTLISYSIYAKAGAYDKLNLVEGTTSLGAWFDLSSGTLGTVSAGVTAKISDEGSGWYRASISFTSSGTSNFLFAFSATETLNYTGSGTIGGYVKQAQLETGDIATDYIATTSAAVSVGPVANVPRLDYLNSSCPRLLLEPQRTNLVTYSEQIDNASWTKEGVTITANATTSPDGYTSADKIVANASAGDKTAYQIHTITPAQAFSLTAFFKKSEYKLAFLRAGGQTEQSYVIYNIDTQAVVSTSGATSTKIENYGNGWYRITLTMASASNATIAPNVSFLPDSGYTLNAANVPAYTGDGTSGGFVWGVQLEANGAAYATSYIPTLGAAVTRGEDACSKTGISSLIGQASGTFFVDITFGQNENPMWYFSMVGTDWTTDSFYLENTASKYIQVSTVKSGAGAGTATSTVQTLAGSRAKIAVQYSGSSLNLFVNGVKFNGARSANPLCSKIYLNEIGTLGGANSYKANQFNQVLTFTSALTDAQCIELTTI